MIKNTIEFCNFCGSPFTLEHPFEMLCNDNLHELDQHRAVPLSRIAVTNQFIETIANCGRQFFKYEDRIAYIFRNKRGHLFMRNEWTKQRMYISKPSPIKYFHHGGTLFALTHMLVRYIKTGQPLKHTFFDSHWGYGGDMNIVINSGLELGILA